MARINDVLTVLLISGGVFFFIAGTVGLIRFPDFYTRIHAMAKADNVGLGLVVAGLALQTETPSALVQLLLVWFLVLLSSVSGAHVLARGAFKRDARPGRRP